MEIKQIDTIDKHLIDMGESHVLYGSHYIKYQISLVL